jgi:hypothetical protein
MSSDWTVWVFFLIIAALLVWNFTRRRKSGSMNLDIAMGILSNADDCIRMIEIRLADPQSKMKFQNASWRAFNKKIDFLGPELVAVLNEAFGMVDDFNQRIDTARKNKMMSTLQDMPVANLKAPMHKAKEGLAAWIKTGYRDEIKNRRGCLGF